MLQFTKRPQNKEELFNLCHSSACNVIEHIFGVLKCWFQILLLAPEYSLEVQAWLPAALAAIQNFISIHNPHDQPISGTTSEGAGQMYDNDDDNDNDAFMGAPGLDDSELHQDIAQKMWDDYINIFAEWGIDIDVQFSLT